MTDRHDLSRRGFLSAAGAAAAGAALGPAAAAVEAADKSLPMATLGKSGQKVTVLSAGTAFNVTPITLRAFQMEGISYIDTAESYNGGNSEKAVGEWFAKSGKRKDTFLVTNAATTTRSPGRRPCLAACSRCRPTTSTPTTCTIWAIQTASTPT